MSRVSTVLGNEGIIDSLTSSTAAGATPVTISLVAGVTLAIFGLSRPKILFIFCGYEIRSLNGNLRIK